MGDDGQDHLMVQRALSIVNEDEFEYENNSFNYKGAHSILGNIV